MKTTIRYEWDIETWDEHGDILDHSHSDKCPGVPKRENRKLVLVRDTGNEVRGVIHRVWAYVKDGQLPKYFERASGHSSFIAVPKRYHLELESTKRRTQKWQKYATVKVIGGGRA